MNNFNLTIVTPQGEIYNSVVKYATFPGSEGEFGVLYNHASVISLLQPGIISIENEDSSMELIAIDSGHVKVDENHIIVLAQGAVYLGGRENSITKQRIDEASKLLESAGANTVTLAATISRLDPK